MTTPNGASIVARLADGSEHDVTTAVQALYDLVISSMDWGSGFWTVEDAEPVVRIAQLCAFAGFEEAEAYVERQRKSEEQARFLARRMTQFRREQTSWLKSNPETEPYRRVMGAYNHDHVFAGTGTCVWPGCGAHDEKKAKPQWRRP